MKIKNKLIVKNNSKYIKYNEIDNIFSQSKIAWFDIDEKGYINKPLGNQAAIYIYMNVSSSFSNKPRYYVGSTANLASRVNSHRYLVLNWNKYKNKGLGSPLFYRSVLKYSWLNFKFGVLEYIYFSNIMSIKERKEIILEKEQYYLNNINPSLNTCKIANSPLGVKRSIMFSINLSKARKGKNRRSSVKINNTIKIVTPEARSKISLRNQGVSVKIFDKSKNLIHEFSTMSSAAKYLGVCTKTISMIYETGKSFDEFIYEFSIKDNRIWVYDTYHLLIRIFDNAKKTSIFFNIPRSTLSDHIKSGKLYKNKYYFYNVSSHNNK